MTRTGEGALLLLRHGHSVSNAADVFTGGSDPPLTDLRVAQVGGAAAALRKFGVRPSCVHTSLLRRSIATAETVMDVLRCGWLYADARYANLPPERWATPVTEPGGRYLDPVSAGEPVRIGRPEGGGR